MTAARKGSLKKTLVLAVKVAILLAVAAFIGNEIRKALTSDAARHIDMGQLHWGYVPWALAGFAGVMLTSAAVWRFLALAMGDRAPTPRLLGAYTYSQMGKYVPGKVLLLWMRIERAGRYGMAMRTCTIATLLENALYMISGGLAGLVTLWIHARDIAAAPYPWARWVLPASAVATGVLVTACHPGIFYGLVNALLRKMGREPVPAQERLRMPTLALSVVLFLPCWFCGGVALWAAASMVHPLPLAAALDFTGAFALSVIVGMASFLPGGLGIRESVVMLFVAMALQPAVGQDAAVLLAGLVAVIQRLVQITVEVSLGLLGAAVTSGRPEAVAAAGPAA